MFLQRGINIKGNGTLGKEKLVIRCFDWTKSLYGEINMLYINLSDSFKILFGIYFHFLHLGLSLQAIWEAKYLF